MNLPVGFNTLWISFNVIDGLGIEHNAYVLTTVSMELSGTDKLSADSIKNSIVKLCFSALFIAILLSSVDGSRPLFFLTLFCS